MSGYRRIECPRQYTGEPLVRDGSHESSVLLAPGRVQICLINYEGCPTDFRLSPEARHQTGGERKLRSTPTIS